MRIILLLVLLFILQGITLCNNPEKTGRIDTTRYRIKHILLEMSEYSTYPIVETIPRFIGGADTLPKYFYRMLSSESNYREFILRLNFKFVVDYNGRISDVEFIGSKKPEIANMLTDGIKRLSKWKPGTDHGVDVTTIAVMSVILNNGRISVDLPTEQNASRLPRMNAGLKGRWIRENNGTDKDTLQIASNSYYESLINDGKRRRVLASIVEHKLDSGFVKLKYRHIYENSNEVQHQSEFFYCVYSSTSRTLYIIKNDSSYPNRNLLEFNATCTIWKKQK